MAITEDKRNDLFDAATAALGREEATTLMEHLPPIGWADVATKSDLAQLEARMDLRFQVMESRFDAKLEKVLREQASRYIGWMTSLFGIFAIVLAVIAALN